MPKWATGADGKSLEQWVYVARMHLKINRSKRPGPGYKRTSTSRNKRKQAIGSRVGLSILTDFGKNRTHISSTFSRLHRNTLWKGKSASDKNIYMRDNLIFPVVSFVNFFFSILSCFTNTIVCHACKFFCQRVFFVNTRRF